MSRAGIREREGGEDAADAANAAELSKACVSKAAKVCYCWLRSCGAAFNQAELV